MDCTRVKKKKKVHLGSVYSRVKTNRKTVHIVPVCMRVKKKKKVHFSLVYTSQKRYISVWFIQVKKGTSRSSLHKGKKKGIQITPISTRGGGRKNIYISPVCMRVKKDTHRSCLQKRKKRGTHRFSKELSFLNELPYYMGNADFISLTQTNKEICRKGTMDL